MFMRVSEPCYYFFVGYSYLIYLPRMISTIRRRSYAQAKDLTPFPDSGGGLENLHSEWVQRVSIRQVELLQESGIARIVVQALQ